MTHSESMDGTHSKKSRGCFYYGCITVLTIVGAVILIALVGGWLGRRWITHHLMSSQPVALSTVTLTNEEQLTTLKKSKILQQWIQSGTTAGGKDVVLQVSDREINAMLQQISGRNESPLKVAIEITGGALGAKGYFHRDEKYINMEMVGTLTGSNGIVIGNIISLKIGDRFVGTGLNLNGKNILSKLYEDPEAIELLKRVKSVFISGNSLDLTLENSK